MKEEKSIIQTLRRNFGFIGEIFDSIDLSDYQYNLVHFEDIDMAFESELNNQSNQEYENSMNVVQGSDNYYFNESELNNQSKQGLEKSNNTNFINLIESNLSVKSGDFFGDISKESIDDSFHIQFEEEKRIHYTSLLSSFKSKNNTNYKEPTISFNQLNKIINGDVLSEEKEINNTIDDRNIYLLNRSKNKILENDTNYKYSTKESSVNDSVINKSTNELKINYKKLPEIPMIDIKKKNKELNETSKFISQKFEIKLKMKRNREKKKTKPKKSNEEIDKFYMRKFNKYLKENIKINESSKKLEFINKINETKKPEILDDKYDKEFIKNILLKDKSITMISKNKEKEKKYSSYNKDVLKNIFSKKGLKDLYDKFLSENENLLPNAIELLDEENKTYIKWRKNNLHLIFSGFFGDYDNFNFNNYKKNEKIYHKKKG